MIMICVVKALCTIHYHASDIMLESLLLQLIYPTAASGHHLKVNIPNVHLKEDNNEIYCF